MLSSPSRVSPYRTAAALPPEPPEPRRLPSFARPFVACAVLVASFAGANLAAESVVGCTPAQKQDAKSVVDKTAPLVDLGCAFGSTIVDAEELAKICGFERAVVPALRELIGYREASRRAGVVWRPSCTAADGGCAAADASADARAAH